jgi:hypothetical protein
MSKRLSQEGGVNSGGDALLGILAPMLSSSGSDSVADGVAGQWAGCLQAADYWEYWALNNA